MSGLEGASERANRAVIGGIVLYFALILYANLANDPIAYAASSVVFGFIAIGVGGLLFRQASGTVTALFGAALFLTVGGIVQLVQVVTGEPIFDVVASIAVFVGIGFYIYAVWFEG